MLLPRDAFKKKKRESKKMKKKRRRELGVKIQNQDPKR